MELRPYQQESKDRIRALFMNGAKRVILCKPTGSGKTVTFASIAADAARKGNRVLILVDRKELLEQAQAKLLAYGLRVSLVTGGKRAARHAQVYVATVQTLLRRPILEVNLIIVDEAHKQSFDKLFAIPAYSEVKTIGATATPVRTGRMTQLRDLYQAIVEPVTITDLLADGFLVEARTFAPDMGVQLKGIRTQMGDYSNKGLFDAFNKSELYAGVTEKYLQFAPDTRAICFNINIEHSQETAAAFRRAGISADHADGGMTKREREDVLARWRRGEFLVLCNCDLFTTGFDEPTIETVIINRATKSLPLYLQMCGRGSRLAPGKTDFTVIDMGGNVKQHGLWQQERDFSLDHEYNKRKGEAPVKECPKCFNFVHTSVMKCGECGYQWPVEEKELIEANFVQAARNHMPEGLEDKRLRDCTMEELERVRVHRGYKLGWIIYQIAERPDLTFEEFERFKGYKKGWANWVKKKFLHKA